MLSDRIGNFVVASKWLKGKRNVFGERKTTVVCVFPMGIVAVAGDGGVRSEFTDEYENGVSVKQREHIGAKIVMWCFGWLSECCIDGGLGRVSRRLTEVSFHGCKIFSRWGKVVW